MVCILSVINRDRSRTNTVFLSFSFLCWTHFSCVSELRVMWSCFLLSYSWHSSTKLASSHVWFKLFFYVDTLNERFWTNVKARYSLPIRATQLVNDKVVDDIATTLFPSEKLLNSHAHSLCIDSTCLGTVEHTSQPLHISGTLSGMHDVGEPWVGETWVHHFAAKTAASIETHSYESDGHRWQHNSWWF